MNRTKRLLSHVRIANSLHSSKFSVSRSLHHQVTPFPISPSPPLSMQSQTSPFVNSHKRQFLSSKPEQTLDLILSIDWSGDLERGRLHTGLALTHETVIYVLKKLGKYPEKASNFFNWVTEKNGFSPSFAMLSSMLHAYANKDWIQQFWVTANKMKEKGLFIDEEAYKSILVILKGLKMDQDAKAFTEFYKNSVKENAMENVVKEVVEIVVNSDWCPAAEKRLQEMQINVSDNLVLRVLRELKPYPSTALKTFEWFARNYAYKHNSITYNAILRVLGQEQSRNKFWEVLNETRNMGHEMDVDTYLKISRRFQKTKMLKDAVELYEYMMDGPYKPSALHLNFLLRAISPDFGLVSRAVVKYEASGNSLSKALYDGIHRSLTYAGELKAAKEIMEKMRNAGYEPDNITYSQLVFGYCKAGKLEEACEVLNLMEASDVIPDIKTWTILIQGHCSAGEVDMAVLCFAKMMEKNIDADADLLDILANAFISQKRVNGAYTLLTEMVKSAHLRPWQETYKKIIRMLLGERKFVEAVELLRMMKKQNHPPFLEPFSEYVSKFGTVEDAFAFLKASSFNAHPSVSVYQNVFESFFREGRQFEAKDMLFRCPVNVRKHKAISSLFGSSENSIASAA